MTAELVPVMDAADAERLTERIRNRIRTMQESIDRLGELIGEAYTGRVWLTLGYETWDGYVAAEFGSDSLRLDRNERKEIVVQLRSVGMSTRAIGSALGVDQKTVVNDVKSGEELSSPESVTGLDGKTYAPRQPEVDDEAEEIVEAELVDEPAPTPTQKPRAPRTDVVAVISRVLTKATDAADAAGQIKRDHLKSRSEEAARWSRDLDNAIQSLQRLADLLTEMK